MSMDDTTAGSGEFRAPEWQVMRPVAPDLGHEGDDYLPVPHDVVRYVKTRYVYRGRGELLPLGDEDEE